MAGIAKARNLDDCIFKALDKTNTDTHIAEYDQRRLDRVDLKHHNA